MSQLALPLGLTAEQTFDTFYVAADNAVAIAALQAMVQARSDEHQIMLWGDAGVGKTHLLTAACHAAAEIGWRVAYLPGEHLNDADALIGLERADLVCMDDLQALQRDSEEALFHALNRCRESHTRVLMASRSHPDELGVSLADLATRMQWGPTFVLVSLPDDDLPAALEQLLMSRDLAWSDDVVPFMLSRYPRDLANLRRSVRALDEASLQAQRRITVPFLKSVL